jgi:hypothetical protein
MPHAARQADFALRRLARLRHQITLPLARAAAAVVHRRAWVDLGYLNEHQFARDFFESSAKTLRNLAALDEPFKKFPALVRAVTGADGRRPIGRCAARRIGRVATTDTIEMWIDRARTLSVRALDAHIRNAERAEATAVSHAGESEANADEATAQAGEAAEPGATAGPGSTDARDEKVLFRIQLPPEARMAYDEVADLHRAFAGHDATPASFLEDLLAEVAASGLWAPDPDRPSPGRFQPAQRGGRKMADAMPGRIRNTTTHGTDEWPTSTTEGRLATRLLKGFDADLRDLARIMRHLEAIDRGEYPESSSKRDDPEGAARPVPRGQICQMREVLRILRNLVRYENQIEVRMGSLLLEQHERRAWPAFECHSLGEYAEERLGWIGSSAGRRVDAARALRRLPIVRNAYESGRIALERTEWIVRATRKATLTEPEQRKWVDHAEPVLIKRLRDESRILRRNRLEHRAAVARAVTLRHGRGAARVSADGRPAPASGPASAPAREAAAPTAPEVTPYCFPVPPDDATWLRSLTRVPGQARDRLLDLEGSLLERVLKRGAMLDENAVFSIPESLARDLLSCLTTLRRRVCREALKSRSAAEEARVLLSVRIAAAYLEQSARVPLWVGLLAALEIGVLEWDDPRRKTASQPLQRRVIERDGCRCTAPGCNARRNLQVNHIQERSQGGPDEEWNLHAVCAAHHLYSIHGGRARVRGRAPGNMVWRIGRPELAQWFVNERRFRSMI